MRLAATKVVRALLISSALLSLLAMSSCGTGGGGGGGGIDFGGASTPVVVMLADSGVEQVIEFHATISSVQMKTSAGSAKDLLTGSATAELTHLAGSAQLLGVG